MSAPAPTTTRVLSQARFETGSLLRNGEQLLVSLVLPLLALVGLKVSTVPSLGPEPRMNLAVPGVMALCVISAAFTAQAISTGFDRRYNVLRFLGTTPLGRGGLLAAKVLATLVIEVIQLAVIGAIGLAMGWEPIVAGIPAALLFVLLGTWTFVALALLLAGTVRAEGVLALANLFWVLFLVGGAVIMPRSTMPAGLGDVARFLPSAGLGDGLRSALADGVFDLPAAAVLLVWAAVATLLARATFRWGE